MKLKDARELYYFFSGKTSDIVRQLGLAGVAIVWLFKVDIAGAPKVPEAMVVPLALIVAGLTLDLLHYAVATCLWGFLQRHKENAGTTDDDEFLAPRQINWPALVLFALKIVFIGAAYVLLLRHLFSVVT